MENTTVLYDGPARFVGWRGREFATERIRELVTLSNDEITTLYSCAECGWEADSTSKVRGHLSKHPLPGQPKGGRPVGSRTRVRHSDEVNEVIEREIARRVERELERDARKRQAEREVAKKKLAAVRRENRELRARLEGIRAAIIGNG